MKYFTCLLSLIGLGWIIYMLFQPIIDHTFGWDTIPKTTFNYKFEGIESEEYEYAIVKSKHLIDSMHLVDEAPSISVATMIEGEIVWSYAAGLKDIRNKIPADTSTQFRIGSVSKALTSLGLGRMIQMGLIHPDSSVQFYTRKFLSKPKITIRQLASHQSGIRNYSTCFCFPIWEYYRNAEFENVNQSLYDFEDDPLLFNPGEAFSYSSYNFNLLSYAMEQAYGDAFLDYMDNEIFQKLKMYNTRPDIKNKPVPNRAIPYAIIDGSFKEAFEVDLSNKWAGGGFLSTPSDLVRAGNALLDTLLLTAEIIDLITNPQALNNGEINEQNYAMGWRHDYSKRYFNGNREVEIIHHGGMAMGGLALLAIYPEYDMVIAIVMNKGESIGNFPMFEYVTPVANAFLKSIDEDKSKI